MWRPAANTVLFLPQRLAHSLTDACRRGAARASPRFRTNLRSKFFALCSELRAVHGARVCTEAYRSDHTKITIVLKDTKLSS